MLIRDAILRLSLEPRTQLKSPRWEDEEVVVDRRISAVVAETSFFCFFLRRHWRRSWEFGRGRVCRSGTTDRGEALNLTPTAPSYFDTVSINQLPIDNTRHNRSHGYRRYSREGPSSVSLWHFLRRTFRYCPLYRQLHSTAAQLIRPARNECRLPHEDPRRVHC